MAWIEAPPTGESLLGTSTASAVRAQAERTAVTGAAALEAGEY